MFLPHIFPLFFFNDTATTEIYTLSLHDALPICAQVAGGDLTLRQVVRRHVSDERRVQNASERLDDQPLRSEEHTSELQSPCNLVCRLLLEKKKHFLVSACV